MKKQIAFVAVLSLLMLTILLAARSKRRTPGQAVEGSRPAAAADADVAKAQPDEEDDALPAGVKKSKEPGNVNPEAAKRQAAAALKQEEEVQSQGVALSFSFGGLGGGEGGGLPSELIVAMATEELKLSDSQKVRVAAWAEWKQKAIAALTEEEAKDPKKAKEIDNAYREGVKSELDQTQNEILQRYYAQPPIQVLSTQVLGGGEGGARPAGGVLGGNRSTKQTQEKK